MPPTEIKAKQEHTATSLSDSDIVTRFVDQGDTSVQIKKDVGQIDINLRRDVGQIDINLRG